MFPHPHERETAEDPVSEIDIGVSSPSQPLDPVALAAHLRLFSLPPWNWGAVEKVDVRMLRQKAGGRCILELDLQTENGLYPLIGKVYSTARPDVFETMERIRQAGFGPRDRFSIPQALAYIPSFQLLVQEKVLGPRAKEIFTTGDERSCTAAAERCARWLARFHAMARKAGSVLYPQDVFNSKSVQQCLSRAADCGGRLADKAARLRQRLKDAESSLSPVELCAGHGSYGVAHVILTEDRTVVFDWDGYDVADPSRDIGRFLASLRHVALGRLGSIRALDTVAQLFLRTYMDVMQRDVTINLPFYEAAASLKLAKHSLYHDRLPKTEATLDEGLRVLDQGVTQ